MNTYANRVMPYGAKARKVLNKEFYLSADDMEELILKLETSSITRMRDVVEFVDQHGEWLD